MKRGRPCVFLRATRCGQGVLAAIRERLGALAEDVTFVRQLLQRGTLGVFVDGPNEAGPTVAESVRVFAEEKTPRSVW